MEGRAVICPRCGQDHGPVTFELPDGSHVHCPIRVAEDAVQAEISSARTEERRDE